MSTDTIKTILVATDFSDHAEIGVRQAATIAKALDADLVLVHVEAEDEGAKPDAPESTAAEELRNVAASIDGLTPQLLLRRGHADDAIAAAAAEVDADLVVTGTRGRTGIKRFFLGSVAEKVVRLAGTNVLVARPCATGYGVFERILVPTDFSSAAEGALHLAMLLAAPGATVELFHAWQYPPGTVAHGSPDDENNPLAALGREIEEAAGKNGDTWLERHKDAELTLRYRQTYGPASSVVQERLEEERFDLVVMGTHGRRGFRRFVLGSVAEATVRHSPCSVLVAHAGRARQESGAPGNRG